MKTRTFIVPLAISLGLPAAFWLYGMARTMRETFHFDPAAGFSGLLFGVALPLLILVPLLIAAKLQSTRLPRPISAPVAAFAFSLLLGSIASEYSILRDEARFTTEAAQFGNHLYSRPRAWPNQICSLVSSPIHGIHSTD